jgi:FKBP-type peptidyl-prolyl cis-trans isomerase
MTVTVLEELKEGASAPLPKLGDKVVVHYSGWLALRPDGEPFDSSREKGHAFTFTVGVGKVIDGWDEAVRAMGKGARRRVVCGSHSNPTCTRAPARAAGAARKMVRR